MYLSLYVGRYRQTYHQLYLELCRALHRQLHRELNLKLHEPLYAALYDETLAVLYLKSDPSLFTLLFGALYREKYRSFEGPICLQLHRQLQLPRRPPGRSPHGRIVVGWSPTTTYRWPQVPEVKQQGCRFSCAVPSAGCLQIAVARARLALVSGADGQRQESAEEPRRASRRAHEERRKQGLRGRVTPLMRDR
jgi:hypothetical protein